MPSYEDLWKRCRLQRSTIVFLALMTVGQAGINIWLNHELHEKEAQLANTFVEERTPPVKQHVEMPRLWGSGSERLCHCVDVLDGGVTHSTCPCLTSSGIVTPLADRRDAGWLLEVLLPGTATGPGEIQWAISWDGRCLKNPHDGGEMVDVGPLEFCPWGSL